MSEKQFPPSDQKLQKLRSEGNFPWSLDLVTAGLFGGFLISWYVFPREEFLGSFSDSFRLHDGEVLQRVPSFLSSLLVPVLVLSLFLWIIQTKAFFRFGKRNRKNQTAFFQRLSRTALSLLKVVFFAVVFGTFFYSQLELLLAESRLTQDQSFLSSLGQTPLKCPVEGSFCPIQDLIQSRLRRDSSVIFAVLGASCILSFLLGILSRFVAGLSFIREHRMSREEVEAEAREAESPPQLRDFRSEQEFLDEV